MAIPVLGQKTPDELADKIVHAFSSGNFESFKSLFFDTNDVKVIFFDISRRNGGKSKEVNLEEELYKFQKLTDTAYPRLFNNLGKKGAGLGVDWGTATPGKFIYEVKTPVGASFRALKGHLNFTSKGATFVFFGIEAIEMKQGFRLTDIETVQKGEVGKYIDPDLIDHDDK